MKLTYRIVKIDPKRGNRRFTATSRLNDSEESMSPIRCNTPEAVHKHMRRMAARWDCELIDETKENHS